MNPMHADPGTAGLRNTLLASLPEDVWRFLRPRLVRVRLIPGQVLVEAEELAQQIFFVCGGLVCLMADAAGAIPQGQLAMIGKEGCVGLMEVVTGRRTAYAAAVVQVGGTALRLSVPDYRMAAERWPQLRAASSEWVQQLIGQVLDEAASNARDSLGQRYLRWLVMAQDRLETEDVQVTHDALAAMLSVRRSGVTVATASLQEKGLIQSGRARIRIVDPAGLRALAGDRVPLLERLPEPHAGGPEA